VGILKQIQIVEKDFQKIFSRLPKVETGIFSRKGKD